MGNMVSLGLGVVNTLLIAAYFGTSEEMDAFGLARVISDAGWVLVPMVVGRVYLPLFVRLRDDRATLSAFFSSVLNLLAILGAALTLLAYAAAPWLAGLLVGPGRPQVAAVALEFLRLLSSVLVLACLYQGWVALAQAERRFGGPVVAQVAGRVAMLAVLLVTGSRWGVHAVVFSVIAACAVSLAVLAASEWHGTRYRPGTSPAAAWLASRGLLVSLAGLAALELLHGLVLRGIAAGMPAGRVAALDYATAVVSLVQVLLVTTLLQGIFPFLADLGRQEDDTALASTIGTWLQVAMAGLIPVSLWLMLVREPLIRLLFSRGAFGEQSVVLTSAAATWYLAGLFPIALAGMLELALLARDRPGWCLVLKTLGVVSSATAAMLLGAVADVAGIGAGISLGYAVQGVVGLWIVVRLLPLRLVPLTATLARVLLAAMLSLLPLTLWTVPQRPVGLLASLALAAGTYVIAAWLLDLPAARLLMRRLFARL